MTARKPRKVTPAPPPPPEPRRDELVEALRKRIYDLEQFAEDRENAMIQAMEALVDPNLRSDEERINRALGLLEE